MLGSWFESVLADALCEKLVRDESDEGFYGKNYRELAFAKAMKTLGQ